MRRPWDGKRVRGAKLTLNKVAFLRGSHTSPWSRPSGRSARPMRSSALPRRVTRNGRASRPSGSARATAGGCGSIGSSSGIESPPCLGPSDVRAIGTERVERPPRGLRPRMPPVHQVPFSCRARTRKLGLSRRRIARHGPSRRLRRGDAGHGRSIRHSCTAINVAARSDARRGRGPRMRSGGPCRMESWPGL